uniref:Neuronal membrane glycoprotein M6-b n=1 Tax=Anisakis simplex TaxID=6269 RepID=A0A0M3JFJ7_ANISI
LIAVLIVFLYTSGLLAILYILIKAGQFDNEARINHQSTATTKGAIQDCKSSCSVIEIRF